MREATLGGRDALDNLCNSPGSVVVGNREFLHDGWIHSHIACHRARRTSPAIDLWTQACCMTKCQEPVCV